MKTIYPVQDQGVVVGEVTLEEALEDIATQMEQLAHNIRSGAIEVSSFEEKSEPLRRYEYGRFVGYEEGTRMAILVYRRHPVEESEG